MDMESKQPCRELEPMLAPYVEGEATREDASRVDAHLQRCPSCRDRVAGERTAREALRARGGSLREPAPPALRARCAAYGRTAPAASRWRRPLALVPLSLAATLLLAVAGVFIFSLNNPVEALAAQLSADHVKCFKIVAEHDHMDAAAAARDWSHTRGWQIGVPPGDDALSLELVGVRRCISTDGSSAHLMYRWRGEPLSVFIVPKTFDVAPGVGRIIENLGHRAIIWSKGPRTYLVIARGRPAGFDAVAAYLRARVE
jgi:anti-sigma factor RsiW